jgi:hypothetical protein
MLGLPYSVKYIDRSKRPKRIFVKREDGTLEDLFQIHVVDSQHQAAEESTVHWDQDPN